MFGIAHLLLSSVHMYVFIVLDAGKTQVEPGSITVVALFGKTYMLEDITGKLPLL